MQKHGSLFKKLDSFCQMDDFSCFFRNWATFCNLLLKSSSKHQNMVVCSKNHRFGQNFATFRTKYHMFAFRWSFQQKVAKSASFREKARKIIHLAKSLQLFEQTTMSWHFYELFSKKLQKVPHSVQKGEKSSIWPKLCNFLEETPMSLHFDQLFEKMLQKVPHFVKQHEKSLISPKLCNFWNKPQCLFPFDELSRKKLQKVRRLVKKHEKSSIWPRLATSRRNYHVLAFRWLLQEKVAKRWKKWLISWKMTKNHRFGLNLQLFEETTMFRRFCQLFSKKWVISWKSTKNRHSEVA